MKKKLIASAFLIAVLAFPLVPVAQTPTPTVEELSAEAERLLEIVDAPIISQEQYTESLEAKNRLLEISDFADAQWKRSDISIVERDEIHGVGSIAKSRANSEEIVFWERSQLPIDQRVIDSGFPDDMLQSVLMMPQYAGQGPLEKWGPFDVWLSEVLRNRGLNELQFITLQGDGTRGVQFLSADGFTTIEIAFRESGGRLMATWFGMNGRLDEANTVSERANLAGLLLQMAGSE